MARNLLGDEDGAIAAFRRAEPLTAANPTLRLRAGVTLSDALHRMGRFDEAIEVGEEYLTWRAPWASSDHSAPSCSRI